ncbi:hypothetical protein XM38_003440 [Halomicronema hongdechloris C2206]|uniref:VWFA domain-containing protein n=2 Tax=Halomicronema hongdechloris TaxID=1209493 RepID=A0A1Z3HGU4_9CYAN|nr:hypothetical protein XM38_003440 [Halomicronema hongdechloris C2206]
MNEGFSGRGATDPLAERGAWRTKLEAASELLLRQIASIRDQDVAVIKFADQAEKIFQGHQSAFSPSSFSVLQGGGRTNLTAALNIVAIDSSFNRYRALSVLILSDGLANIGNPQIEAERIIERYPFARIDTILIDETDQGRAIAESVSINGSVRNAVSILQLQDSVERARVAGLQQEISGLAQRQLALESELSAIANVSTPTLLTVTSQVSLTPSSLRDQISPFLTGIEEIQEVASTASGASYRGRIRSISQSSPVSISLSGLREAVELFLEWIVPWRREHVEQMLVLQRRREELEQRKLEMDLGRENAELDALELSNRRLELELLTSKLELAERLLNHLDPNENMSGSERVAYVQKLVGSIDRLASNRLEFQASGPGFESRSNIQ